MVPALVTVSGGVSETFKSSPMVSRLSDDAPLTTSKPESIITLSRVVSNVSIMMSNEQQKSCHQVSVGARQTVIPPFHRQYHTDIRFPPWILPLGRPLPAPPPLWSSSTSSQSIAIRKGGSGRRTCQSSRKRARSWCDGTRKNRKKVVCCSLSSSKANESDERSIDAAVTLSTLSTKPSSLKSDHKTFQTRPALPPPPFQLFAARR